MNNYILKQNIAFGGYEYFVEDTNNNMVYNIKSTSMITSVDKFIGGIISIPFSMTIFNKKSSDTLTLRTKLGIMFKNYEVWNKNEIIASINTKKAIGVPKIDIKSEHGKFKIHTNMMARRFDILKDEVIVASIKKVTLSLKDAYEITNIDFENTDLLIAIVVSLDNNFHD